MMGSILTHVQNNHTIRSAARACPARGRGGGRSARRVPRPAHGRIAANGTHGRHIRPDPYVKVELMVSDPPAWGGDRSRGCHTTKGGSPRHGADPRRDDIVPRGAYGRTIVGNWLARSGGLGQAMGVGPGGDLGAAG